MTQPCRRATIAGTKSRVRWTMASQLTRTWLSSCRCELRAPARTAQACVVDENVDLEIGRCFEDGFRGSWIVEIRND